MEANLTGKAFITHFSLKEELGIAREKWPVYGGIPIDKGKAFTEAGLCLTDDKGFNISADFKVLSRWEDNSIRWLFVAFVANIMPLEEKVFIIEVLDNISMINKSLSERCEITENHEYFIIRSKELEININKRHYQIFDTVKINGKAIVQNQNSSGFYVIDKNNCIYDSLYSSDLKIYIEENGKVRTVLRVEGKHCSKEGGALTGFIARYFIFSDANIVEVHYSVVNNAEQKYIEFKRLGCEIQMSSEKSRLICGNFGGILDFDSECSVYVDKIIDTSNLGKCCYVSTEFENGQRKNKPNDMHVHPWVGLEDGNKGVAITVYKMIENYPKEYRYDGKNKVDIALWDSTTSGNLTMLQGMAKTHKMYFNFFERDIVLSEIHKTMKAFEDPQILYAGNAYEASKAIGCFLGYAPLKYPQFEMFLRDAFHLWKSANMPFGFMDFGDSPQLGDDGRQDFMGNNEHDFPHSMLIQYMRTGEKDYYYAAEAAVMHMTDIDTIHYSVFDEITGGVRVHGPNHNQELNNGKVFITNSHMWLDGILEYYYLTGDRKMLDIALLIGKCFMRNKNRLLTSDPDREQAWTLIALTSLYEAVRDPDIYDFCREIAEYIMQWQQKNGKLERTFGFRLSFSILHESILTVGLYRFYEICEDTNIKETLAGSIAKNVDIIMEHGMYKDGGFVYVDYPGYRFNRCGGDIQEAFGYAYAVTGDKKYIGIANRDLFRTHDVIMALLSPFGSKIRDNHQLVNVFNHNIAMNWRGLFRFMYWADKSGQGKDIFEL